MDAFNLFREAYYIARIARDCSRYDEAIHHLNNALEFYRASSYQDPHLWLQVLFHRADVFLRIHRYKEATQDIFRALNDCSQTVYDHNEAKLWLNNAPVNNPAVSLACCDAALHFAHGDTRLQCVIHARRALAFSELNEPQERDKAIKKCSDYDPEFSLKQGLDWEHKGIYLFREKEFKNSVRFLRLAEKILEPFDTPHRHNCFNFMASAAWKSKEYSVALQAGKKCYELKPIKDKNEAFRWKMKGNEILEYNKYQCAVECYSLAIEYAPLADVEGLGILHSNRSLAHFRMKRYKEAKKDAEKCLKCRPEWSKSYHRLGSALLEMHRYDHAMDVLQKGLNIDRSFDEQYQIFNKIMEIVFRCEDGPRKIIFDLPPECMRKYVKECVDRKDWGKLELLFLGCGDQKYVGDCLAIGCDVSEISLNDMIKSKKKGTNINKLLTVLIDHGANVNGTGKQPPLAVAVDEKEYESAVVLLERKADVIGLLRSKLSRPDDTPTHTAFRIGLSSGFWGVFSYLMENYERFTDNCIPEVVDKRGNTLFHLIAYGERMSSHSVDGIALLKSYSFDPRRRNTNAQTPLAMLVQRKDERYRLIEEIVKSHSSKKKKKKKKKKDSEITCNENNLTTLQDKTSVAPQNSGQPQEDEVEKPKTNYEDVQNVYPISELEKISQTIDKFINDLDIKVYALQGNEKVTVSCNLVKQEDEKLHPLINYPSDIPVQDENPLPSCSSHGDNPRDDEDVFEADTDMTFDNLTWEVECTSDVWKVLNDKKRLSARMKKQIIKIIKELAHGDMRGSLAKPLVGPPKQNNIRLYEAKLSRGARILWELAIAFSPRCSNNPEFLGEKKDECKGEIYSDIIRVWDIVLDHDTVPRKIEKIVQSHRRGSSCIIKKQLKGFKVQPKCPSINKDNLVIPNLYQHKYILEKQSKHEQLQGNLDSDRSTQFFPPGSPEETEYHILKFYAFSNSLVNAVLDDRRENNVDFPFRVSELEHAVINLKPNPMSSLLLLGRSGTGKTTCCLYRLWFNFESYWQRHIMEEPGIPKLAEFIPKEREDNTKNDDEDGDNDGGDAGRNDEDGVEDRRNDRSECQSSINVKEVDQDYVVSQATSCRDDLEATEKEPTYEHLHQAFITKNAVLCTEVQKNFLDLSQACPATLSHSQHERSSSVNKFDQLQEQDWPLFICSRDWLLMLDASLPEPAFFPRNDEGELVRNVKGWGEEDNHLHIILEESSEDEDDDDEVKEVDLLKNEDDSRASRGTDPRLEVTYQVFKNEMWAKMTKKRKVHYHPTLVWTEIRSFIKGSVEALHSKNGYITLEEYQTLGRKRAPSFSADRETVYDLFLAYHRIKYSKGMFDEADLVHQIYHRLQGYVPEWSIHEIYVDETQDFSQAELSVIIRCCRDPNRLFFTGDTAQSIMRGIAFRFNDLKSIFYYMKESYKAVGQQAQVRVPDRVYQLTHNYRSHTGILNLASSVIDLLLHFFPESFDKLERDQGLFHGPKPVLLESCSFSDLAVILRGHKRKTSTIEFGAHQVVLVPSDEVRDCLPEELKLALVMTIYEAKGLEFDDVLIYNFFKESQAHKEWRVVSSYKDQADVNVVSETAGIAEILEDNLETKSRPLQFDGDRHKILISEFKYLYTALTRARVNVWLFDEDEEARAPMFEYFIKRGVVEVKRPHKTGDDKVSLEGMFAEKSSKDEWRNRGNFFYGKGLWKVAIQCFIMAEDEPMRMKCHAQMQAVHAASLRNEPRRLKVEFTKAAQLFLQCGMIEEAVICLHNARARLLLAKLHHKCGNFIKAAKLFCKEKRFVEASESFEKGLDFMRAVDCLLQNQSYYLQALDVIARCGKLVQEKGGEVMVTVPRVDQREESICYQAAEYYLKYGKLDLMKSALEKLPETKDRITFLQKNACYEQAADLLLQEGKPQEAAVLMRSNGKFLKATPFTDDDKFAAECYLLATRSTMLSKGSGVNTTNSGEFEEFIEGPLNRASELYKRCNDVNGQAETKFSRGRFYGSISDLEEAGKLYYRAANYIGVADCFLCMIDLEKDPKRFSRRKAFDTTWGVLHLILALHKKKRENKDHKAILMCETYFGLVKTEDAYARKVPQLEMTRFTDLQINDDIKNKEVINVEVAYNAIKEHLYDVATNLIQQAWNRHGNINKLYKPCSRYLAGDVSCDEETCKFYHGNLTQQHFADHFYALCFLIELDAMVAKFLKYLRRESAKVSNHLRERLGIFKACERLDDLLFPCSSELGQFYFLTERDLCFLREKQSIRYRIIEYAKSLWCSAEEEARWSDSDLFIRVSNLMHVAAAPGPEIFSLLYVEERKFERFVAEQTSSKDSNGFFPDARTPGRYQIFSKWLEYSKNSLYNHGDILKASHSVIKTFLYTPAHRRTMPYPSNANALIILEYYMTACLVLYSRLMMNNYAVCLPKSYLFLTKFCDMVNMSKPNQSSLRIAIQHHAPLFFVEERIRTYTLDRLHRLTESMVMLMFGMISRRYNVFTAALCDRTVNCGEAERGLILALTMLCNCGRGIPQSCETLIRQEILKLQPRDHLPSKLRQCIEAVQKSQGVFDVVNVLQELLGEKPGEEKLLDVMWDEVKGKEFYRNCQLECYPRHFHYHLDINQMSHEQESNNYSQESNDVADTEKDENLDDLKETFGENHDYVPDLEDKENKKVRINACLLIEQAFINWKKRKASLADQQKDAKDDPVDRHFQMFKLDKSACTICGNVPFEDHSLELSASNDMTGPSSSSHNVEETTSDWRSQTRTRNTFNSHCSRGSPHWKREKQFKHFKEIYRNEIYPIINKAQRLYKEMEVLNNKTNLKCSLDLDTLQRAQTTLRITMQKVESACHWDRINLLHDATREIIKAIKQLEMIQSSKDRLKAGAKKQHIETTANNNVSESDDSGKDDGGNIDSLSHLKDVNTLRKKGQVKSRSRKRKK